MKNIKLILSFVFLLAFAISCSVPDGIDNDLSFLNSGKAPSGISGVFDITQDNTGVVTIRPNGEGVTSYEVYFGDGTLTAAKVLPGNTVSHTYKEGTYTVKIVGYGITGLKTEKTENLVVSFIPPTNLVVTYANDGATSLKVNVTASADNATMFDVYFGETGNTVPVSANNGATASYTYKAAGTYSIRVVAKSGAIKTIEETKSFVVTAILQPTSSAPAQPSRQAANVKSVFSGAYTDIAASNYNPNWGQSGTYSLFDLKGDKMLNYIKLSYQGIDIGSALDASSMEFLHIDIWSPTTMSIDIYPLPDGVISANEKFVKKSLIANQWNSFDIPLSEFKSQGLPLGNLKQFKFVANPSGSTVFIDNLYFYKIATASTGLEGTWKMAKEAGSLKVGPSSGSGDWWSISLADTDIRACFYDDTFVFGSNGTFTNVQGTQTWLETWQGVTTEACGTPVAPFDGKTASTYLYDAVAKTITITGKGSYLGLPKANNTGELPKVSATNSITYNVTLTDNNNTMNLVIEAGTGVFWSFKLVRN